MATVLDTFITKFRFESDKGDLKRIESGLEDFQGKLIKIGATIFGLLSGGELLGRISETVDGMQKFADSVGISVQQLQELQYAADRAGVPINALRSSIENLNSRVGQAARGYGIYGETFARFGVSIRNADGSVKNAYQTLLELNRIFQRLSRSQQYDLAQNIGINPQTIKLLQQTPREFIEIIRRSKELGEFSSKNTKVFVEFEDSLAGLKRSFFELSVQIASGFIPILNSMTKFVVDVNSYFTKHAMALKVIKSLLLGIGITISTILAKSAFSTILSGTIIFWNVLKKIIGVLTAIGAIFELPLAGFIGVLTALVLLVQDIWTGFKGGKSVIFDFIKNSKIIQDVWNSISRVIGLTISEFNKAAAYTDRVISNIGKTFSKGEKWIVGEIAPYLSSSSPSNSISNMNTNNKNTTLNVGGINITTTSNNPSDIANAVTNHLKNEFKTSVNYFDSEIAR